jgi:hypothetical protein
MLGHGPSAIARDSRALADVFLRACAVGAPCGELAVVLADTVLSHEVVRLAEEVRRGGPHAVTRAIELAEAILRCPADATEGRVARA